MRLLKFLATAVSCHLFLFVPARAELAGEVGITDPQCQTGLATTSPVVQRLSLPFVDKDNRKVALTSVIPDFDRERDVVVGIRPGKHTYLINALIGRHDPGIFGNRGRFHDNDQVRRLAVSPGLIVRLRLSAPLVSRVALEMARLRKARSLTCTNTTARILSNAGVPGVNSFILTPIQLLRALGQVENSEARFYLVNTDADSLKDFEDRVKVLGAKKTPPPPVDEERRGRAAAGSCDDEDSANCCMFAFFDLDSCTAPGTSGCAESGACESGGCESGACESGGSDCGGSESDCGGSDC